MEKLIIELAKLKDINPILNILEKRCIWMEKNNIKQWKSNSYTSSFNYNYFSREIKKKTLYIARINTKVGGLFLIKEEDKLWEDSESAFYIHHLATDINYKGLGKIIIEYIKYIALRCNKSYIRLDCVKDNKKLNNYYKKLRFYLKGNGKIRDYKYSLRELRLKDF